MGIPMTRTVRVGCAPSAASAPLPLPSIRIYPRMRVFVSDSGFRRPIQRHDVVIDRPVCLLQHFRDLVEAQTASGEERHLFAHMTACFGVAQVAHEIDQLTRVIGFQRKDPLVVTQRE